MNFSRNFKFRAMAISLALIASSFVSTGASNAVTVTPFTALYNKNINGQVFVAGNSNMTCPTQADALGKAVSAAESVACQEARIRTIKSGLNLNNNAYRMIYSGAGSYGNKSMINSSTGNVTIPVGSTIKSAFLFWHGDMSKPSNADGGKAYNLGVAKGCETDATFCRDNVWLITPKSSAAQMITADVMSSENPTSGIYRAHADITKDLVQINDNKWDVANGLKSITVRVGDIESAQGRDTQAGWSIIVAYAHPNEDLRNVVIYGGLAKIAQNDPAEVTLTGLQTPPSGNVTTTFGVVAAEGDASEGGDFLTLLSGTTSTTVADATNPANNPANSTISQNGALQSYFDNTEGRYTNTFGTDADLFTLNNVIPNSATSATVRMGTNFETYYPIAFTVATELYSPEIQLTKIATGVTKSDGTTPETSSVDSGDRITYRIYFTNVATAGTATDIVVSDVLPANLTFLSTPSSGIGCSGSGQTFTCSIGDLVAGGNGYADFVVTVGSGSGTFTNYATANYSGPAGTLEATSNVVTFEYTKYTPDLITVIDTEEDTIASGGSTTLEVSVRNEGPTTDADFEVVITVPEETLVTPPSGCSAAGVTITCNETAGIESSSDDNSLNAGEFITISIPAVLPADGAVYEFVSNLVSSDLEAGIDLGGDALSSGGSTTLEVSVRNEAPATDADFEVIITVPEETLVTPPSGCSAAGVTITCNETAGIESSSDDNSLNAGEFTTISIPAVLPADVEAAQFSATVVGSRSDTSSANNNQSLILPSNSFSAAVQTFVAMPKNKKPKAKPASVITKRNTAIGIDVTSLISDPNYDEMTVKFTKPKKKQGTVTLSGNTFTFTPKKNFIGTATFYYIVTDIKGAKSKKTKVTVKVTKSGKKTNNVKRCFIQTGC